ncbi:hypothetical protein Scep_029405 [Stephania cephalantha]|uniref:Uncharacterized protein n=1 Tax=Stephania cephalantha TaxID=152367 RepID=A0AAP0HDI1_9MAGN
MSPSSDVLGADHIKMAGKNIGAVMNISHGGPTGKCKNCCFINININSNDQGINNSIVLGSEVRMRDSGVHLCLRDLDMKNVSFKKKKKLKKKKIIKESCTYINFMFTYGHNICKRPVATLLRRSTLGDRRVSLEKSDFSLRVRILILCLAMCQRFAYRLYGAGHGTDGNDKVKIESSNLPAL